MRITCQRINARRNRNVYARISEQRWDGSSLASRVKLTQYYFVFNQLVDVPVTSLTVSILRSPCLLVKSVWYSV